MRGLPQWAKQEQCNFCTLALARALQLLLVSLSPFSEIGEIWARLVDSKASGKFAGLLGLEAIDQEYRVQLAK